MKQSKKLHVGLILVAFVISCCVVVSADYDWERYMIDVDVKVFERQERGRVVNDFELGEGIELEIYHFDEFGGIWKSYKTNSHGEVHTEVESWVRAGDGKRAARNQAERWVDVRVVRVAHYQRSQWALLDKTIDTRGYHIIIEIYLDLPGLDLPDEGPSHFFTDFSQGIEELSPNEGVIVAAGEARFSDSDPSGEFILPGAYTDFILDVDYSFVKSTACYGGFWIYFRETSSRNYILGPAWYREDENQSSLVLYIVEYGKTKPLFWRKNLFYIPSSSHLRLSMRGSHIIVEVGGQKIVDIYDSKVKNPGSIWIQGATDSNCCYVALDNLEVQPLR